ncbi:hypothetical protein A3D84_01135 [Candidatus Woesebacteria bacterium RIFCSPHIGHO2_02_FULL_42_20]|uniref:Solute-binding protein family 5 domain-containing protein n=1 Tax=Candidatus Woesebacteria bacterium RIFCSPHIGHO2_12_FULL_41_24 TaxID=1802510 RepID=A0A1F8AQ77_9BACT|nr:MAG: hypothetical protein A2W15_05360 [Candidatus Woesebacteria bacterium RBG_16_41_13]OGM30719.1 MAG: hypothetical protein A2873_01255 [Candidatus Woesebacteria bacterium RIFCSPHIGHO2_01_FULL_42_80]OGM35856.1 MAG: hypothetical protein A3D84_01135 [Candidatus Woesebacteria bacterium RIFCSPHIGHO2_02_FULL_42_20]OGM53914.1 MAG: hypothetical protein A3E44_05900 [Candidatus Woesebacteria bacterium RIFCSPHIGHO2_12_FULL_41_24]OGM66106.1 MAG: hypothetical protein A2969_03995 [Candidatus Woesebacteri
MVNKSISFTLRYTLRLVVEFISRYKALFLVSFIFGALVFIVAGAVLPGILSSKIDRIGMAGKFTVEDIPYSIQRILSRGLTKLKANGEIEPDLAVSWETPDKGKTWIFHLAQNIRWNDNTPLISRDLNYNFSDVEIQFPDDQTVVFTLSTPYSPFPTIVSKPVFKRGLLGSSNWQVDKLTLTGNFIQALAIRDNRGRRKIYKFYPTEDQTKLAYRLAEVDVIEDLIDPSPLNSWPMTQTRQRVNDSRIVVIFLNTTDSLLADKSIRQALAYSIDKRTFGVRAISPISSSSWSFNPQVKSYDQDVVRAKEIITDYLKTKDDKRIEVKLASYPSLLGVAEKISQDWEKIGVSTSVQVSSITPVAYQAFLAIYDIPSDPDQYAVWHSTQVETNITKYASPRIDKLLEDGRTELEFANRKKIYLDFQRFLLEDSPAIFLYYPEYYTIERL